MFSVEELWHSLVNDAKSIGLPIDDVELKIRPYSKTYYGNYYPQYDSDRKPRVYLYPFKSKGMNCNMYKYDFLMDTLIHEMVHHIQHTSPNFVRVAGIMHDEEFWTIYNRYMYKAKLMGVISDAYEGKAA